MSTSVAHSASASVTVIWRFVGALAASGACVANMPVSGSAAANPQSPRIAVTSTPGSMLSCVTTKNRGTGVSAGRSRADVDRTYPHEVAQMDWWRRKPMIEEGDRRAR